MMMVSRFRHLTALAAGLLLLSPIRGDAWVGEAPSWRETVLALIGSSNLIRDANGALYGTRAYGAGLGQGGTGAAFKLTPPVPGATTWSTTILHAFGTTPGDGTEPQSGFIADAQGDLYGTTYYGGTVACDGSLGCGTVFELSPPAAGQTAWTETILHSFNYPEGVQPSAELIADARGNLYGTTVTGGTYNCGSVFRLSPPAAGKSAWSLTVLHQFSGYPEGRVPQALLAGPHGVIYGTTRQGGVLGYDMGTIFALTPALSGYTLSTLYSFMPGTGGAFPTSGLVIDAHGALYGTTNKGGQPGQGGTGAVFRLAPPTTGQPGWTESTLFAFSFAGTAGGFPQAGLVAEGGNLYGSATYGGPYGAGMVYKLAPPAPGQTAWTQTVLHYFGNTGLADRRPATRLVTDGRGTLFGSSVGTIFALTPR